MDNEDFMRRINLLRAAKTEREIEESYLKKFSVTISKKLELKRYIFPIAIGFIASFVIMIYSWNGDDPVGSSMDVFNNCMGIILLFIQAFKPNEDDINNMEKNLTATQDILKRTIDSKEEYKNQMKNLKKEIDNLIDIIKDLKSLGTNEFKDFMENLKVENIDKTKFKQVVDRQKVLIDKLSNTVYEHDKIVSDEMLQSFALKLDNFTSNVKIFDALKKSNLSEEIKMDILELIDESKKVSKCYEGQRNIMKSFSFKRRRSSLGLENVINFNMPGQCDDIVIDVNDVHDDFFG